MARKANKLAIYYLNLHKRYDLDVTRNLHNKIHLELSTVPADNWYGLGQSSLLLVHDDHWAGGHLQK